MKSVFVAFDSYCHQPKSTNMLMTQKNDFTIDSLYIDDINTLNKIYDDFKPNVLLIDTLFEKSTMIKFLMNFQKKNKNECKIIMTFKNKNDKYDYAQTKIPARLFPYRVPGYVIFASFKEMLDGKIFSHDEKIDDLIYDLRLNISSPVTRQFRDCLEILTCDNSKYLLFGYLYNAFYTTSKLEDVSLDTIRKSVYKVKQEINLNISSTLRHSIFRDNDINSMNLPDFFDYIVEYLEDENKGTF